MTSFLDTVESLFKHRDLYEVLGLEKSASESQVKKAYYKASLKVHPDRVDESEKESATAKFQALVKLYGILSDKEKRALYDEQGIVDDEDSVETDKDWYDYWRQRFSKITIDEVEAYAKTYRESDEEKQDLKEAYVTHEGSMKDIMTCVLCCTYEDEERFRVLIDGWIAEGEVPKFKAYRKESEKDRKKRRRRAEAEAEEAEEALKEMGCKAGNEQSLTALIQSRQAKRQGEMDGFLASLEAKYANGGSGKKSKSKKPKERAMSAPKAKRTKKS